MSTPGPVRLLAAACKLAAASALLLAAPQPARAEAADEYAAKAAFIYNIALFVGFPATNGVVHLCVIGRDPFGNTLASLEGKPLGDAKIAIAYPRSRSEAAKLCRIVFISASENDNLASLASLGKEAGVMTIADVRGAARKGVMLELYVDAQRIVFEFNGEAAHAANITLSSKVLRLARAVY
jgi:hypothetical protein